MRSSAEVSLRASCNVGCIVEPVPQFLPMQGERQCSALKSQLEFSDDVYQLRCGQVWR